MENILERGELVISYLVEMEMKMITNVLLAFVMWVGCARHMMCSRSHHVLIKICFHFV